MTPDDDVRTRRVVELLREGCSDTRIARRLGVPPDEVRRIVDRMIAQARLDDARTVAALADELGLSDELSGA